MKGVVTKPTKRNKCDYCDELAAYKLKENKSDPYSYLCNNCYKDAINSKKL